MTRESYIARTKDNHIVVFTIDFDNPAEKARKELECRNSCYNLTLEEFHDDRNAHLHDHIPSYDAVDVVNTEFLNREISWYHYAKNRAAYDNQLCDNSNFSVAANRPNTIHFDNTISDDLIPEMIKNIGFKLVPVDVIYTATFNSDTGEYELVGEHGEVFDRRVATVKHSENVMEIVRNHFVFEAGDYNELTSLINDFEQQKQQNSQLTISSFAAQLTNPHSKALLQVYDSGHRPSQQKDVTVLHELKHIKNSVLKAGAGLKNDAKSMSIEDVYRINVEDERSAYFNEWVNSINTYLQKGDFNDYSMFTHGSETVLNKLVGMQTEAEKIAYLTDYSVLMRDFEQYFETEKRNYYEWGLMADGSVGNGPQFDADGSRVGKIGQFEKNLANDVLNIPVAAAPDTDREEYNKVRSLYFHYEVYNPQTHQMEYKNLAEFMPEVVIPDNVRTTVIQPNEIKLQQRIDKYNDDIANHRINPLLIPEAKKVIRGSIDGQAFIDKVDDIEISKLYDSNEVPQNVPDDHAEWSDNLQAYWSRVAGYQEIAKNNNEYRFKINEATISYESQRRVQVSANAPYDLYVKLLHEPTNADKPVKFLDTLSREQALTLYVACINNGRRMSGAVPTDFSGIENIAGIPPAALNRFRHSMAAHNTNRTEQAATPIMRAPNNVMLTARNAGR